MRRIASTAAVLLLLAGFVVVATGAASHHESGAEYFVELDNGFGLIQGGDLKIAGVRAGKITKLELDRRTLHARVGFDVTRDGFGDLRTDTHCVSRPQSLIGEYFIDCDPGTSARKLPHGATIPVEQTESTVGPDLVNTILREPYRERLSLIVNELGAAVAGNAQNLDAAIRRASPALRETDKVLATLSGQRAVIADLTTNADRVLADLAANRVDVGRFVRTARTTAVVSATRRAQLAAGFRRLPAFLEQLTPTMARLGDVADQQTPALQDLHAESTQLKELFDRLGPFADANRPAVRALGRASVTGDAAVKAAAPVATELHRFTRGTPELAKNLAIVLAHLDDPSFAAEADPRAAKASGRPAPTGYTGLEALLQYVFDQASSTNVYDQNSHILKVSVLAGGDCAPYADQARGKQYAKECGAALGPHSPGINFTDPSENDPDPPGAIDPDRADARASTPTAGARAASSVASSAAARSAASAPAPALAQASHLLDYLFGT